MEKGKTLFGMKVESISKTIIAAVTASSMLLTGIFFMMGKFFDPIDRYVSLQVVRSIEKQVWKIENDPEDIKPEDLKNAVNDYGKFLCEEFKTPILETNIERINSFLQVQVKK